MHWQLSSTVCSVRAAQTGAKLQCDVAQDCLLKAINNLPKCHKSSRLKRWHISAMLVKSVHRLPSEALGKKNSTGIWQSHVCPDCGYREGSSQARQMPEGPEEEATGVGCSQPCFLPAETLRSRTSHTRTPVKAGSAGSSAPAWGAAAGSVGDGNGASGQPCFIGMGKFQLSCCTRLLCVPVAPLQDRVLLQKCLPLLHESCFGW